MRCSSLLCELTVVLCVVGCDRTPPGQELPGGTMPAVTNAVGPVPGPSRVRAQSNPYAREPAVLTQGMTLFNQYNCSGCHGPHAGGGMGPSLRDEAWIYGGGDADIYDSIAEGRGNGMPAWGAKIPEQQIWAMVAFIKSFRTVDEPSPPDQSTPAPPTDVLWPASH